LLEVTRPDVAAAPHKPGRWARRLTGLPGRSGAQVSGSAGFRRHEPGNPDSACSHWSVAVEGLAGQGGVSRGPVAILGTAGGLSAALH